MNYIPIGIGLSLLSCAGAAISMGLATGKAVESVARQPEASGKIMSMLLMGLALTESAAIYGLVTGLLMMFTMK